MSQRLPSRKLADLSLDEADYKPDFEITTKYQSFSSEILRIALLGIGLYGFLLAHGTDKEGPVLELLKRTLEYRAFIAFSLFLFGIAALCALGHGFCATKCLGFQLTIARLLKRQELDHWSAGEKENMKGMMEKAQATQKKVLEAG